MIRDLVIGLDASTSATKAIAWDKRGGFVAAGRAALSLQNPKPDHFEQAPEAWWRSAADALRELTAEVDPTRFAGLAISNQRESFGAFTRDGAALRPGLVWLDDRARAQMRRFADSFDAARLHDISGKPLSPQPCLFRMMWLQEHEPEMFARAQVFAEVHGYLAFRLTGRWMTSTASADPMGLLDMRDYAWSREILDAAGIKLDTMCDLARPGEFIGEITNAVAVATGLPRGLPVFAGGGDGQCAGTGVGALAGDRAYINLGTAAVAGVYSETYAADRAFRTEVAIADRGYICETVVRTGAFLVDWLVGEMFGVAPENRRAALAHLEAEAAACPIGAGGLLAVPYWQGSMSPHWDGDARGIVAGFTASTRRPHLFRAILEGVAMETADALARAIEVTGASIEGCVAIGGGAGSDLWAQILADAGGRPVLRSATTEASSLGAAMAAAKGAGWGATLREVAQAMTSAPVETFEPDPGRVARYRELREIHADLWPLISAWNQRLVGFARGLHKPTSPPLTPPRE